MKVMSEEYLEYLKEAYSKVDKNRYFKKFLLVDFKKGFCIADVGCGLGLFLQKLDNIAESNDVSLVGVDINIYALRHARKLVPKAHILRGSADKLPFQDKRVNVVFALDLIGNLENAQSFLKEIYRVLDCDGKFVMSTPDRMSICLSLRKNSLKKVMFNFKRLLGIAKVDPTHVKEFTVWGLSKILDNAGFSTEKSDGYKIRYVPLHLRGSIVVCCRKMNRQY